MKEEKLSLQVLSIGIQEFLGSLIAAWSGRGVSFASSVNSEASWIQESFSYRMVATAGDFSDQLRH
jgi:hypothetical protein